MGQFPTTPRDTFLNWVGERADLWVAKATDIGVTVLQATAMKNAYSAALTAVMEQGIAKNAAKQATLDATVALRELRVLVSENVARIKVFAEASAEPATVYGIANIDPPAPPTATPAPGQPFELKVALLPTGGLGLSWKCVNPGNVGGVIYEVQRKMGAAGNFSYIGSSGTRSFNDETIPAGFGGAANVTYRITGARSTQRGPSSDFLINFGVGSGEGMTVTMLTAPATTEPFKMAA